MAKTKNALGGDPVKIKTTTTKIKDELDKIEYANNQLEQMVLTMETKIWYGSTRAEKWYKTTRDHIENTKKVLISMREANNKVITIADALDQSKSS